MLHRRSLLASAFMGGASLVAGSATARAEDAPSERIYETRTLLFVRPPEPAIQELLPKGWQSVAIPEGPAAGATLTVVLIDRLLATDSAGKPLEPASNRLLVLAAPARPEGEGKPVTTILGGISADPAGAPGYYRAYRAGTVTLRRQDGSSAPGAVEEAWSASAEGGDRLTLDLAWTRATPAFSTFDQRIASSVEPKRRRRYVGDQGTVLIRSLPLKVDRASRFALTTGGPLLGRVAGADLVAAMSLAWYRRETYVLG